MEKESNYFLAVNTSFSQAEIALGKNSLIAASITWEKQGSHSELITQKFLQIMADTSITLNDVDHIYCVIGPGSFTGLRVGVNFCKSLAYARNCLLTPINSLEFLASACDQKDRKVLSLIDAQKNSVFYSIFDQDLSTIVANKVLWLKDLPTFLKNEKYSKYFIQTLDFLNRKLHLL